MSALIKHAYTNLGAIADSKLATGEILIPGAHGQQYPPLEYLPLDPLKFRRRALREHMLHLIYAARQPQLPSLELPEFIQLVDASVPTLPEQISATRREHSRLIRLERTCAAIEAELAFTFGKVA